MSMKNSYDTIGIRTRELPAYKAVLQPTGDHDSTVLKVLCYKSEGRWFDPSWCQWIFH